jgi:hypothetical protein
MRVAICRFVWCACVAVPYIDICRLYPHLLWLGSLWVLSMFLVDPVHWCVAYTHSYVLATPVMLGFCSGDTRVGALRCWYRCSERVGTTVKPRSVFSWYPGVGLTVFVRVAVYISGVAWFRFTLGFGLGSRGVWCVWNKVCGIFVWYGFAVLGGTGGTGSVPRSFRFWFVCINYACGYVWVGFVRMCLCLVYEYIHIYVYIYTPTISTRILARYPVSVFMHL